jgi:predicted acyltransferase
MGEKPPAAPARLRSIDALRGFDMFWIIGGDAALITLAKWDNSLWVSWVPASARRTVIEQLEHVEWQGFHFYDLIFPLFLFVVGAVIPFSLAAHQERGGGRAALYWRIARRTKLLFALGLLCNGFLQLDFTNLRVAGVLQRIALCYGAAALLVMHCRPRGLVVATLVILLGYWALLAFVPAPGGSAGDYSKAGNLAGYVDRQYLPGKIMAAYYGDGDNEGIVSTLPAVATALFGVLAGYWLRSARSPRAKVLGLAVAGVVCLLLGEGWGLVFPIIKILWTSSYVLVAGGWSLLLLALFYGVIDVLGYWRWSFFFLVIGANAITIYVVQRFMDFSKMAAFFLGGVMRHSGSFAPVVLALGILAVKWLFLLYLYRRRLFLRV